MEKRAVIEYFDRCAPDWDAGMVKNDAIIGTILDNAEVGAGMHVLDVACGTGVMFDYLAGDWRSSRSSLSNRSSPI